MSRDEMMNEKVDTQKELLTFESQNGRPVRIVFDYIFGLFSSVLAIFIGVLFMYKNIFVNRVRA